MRPVVARGLIILGIYIILSQLVAAGADFGPAKLLLGPIQSVEPALLNMHDKLKYPELHNDAFIWIPALDWLLGLGLVALGAFRIKWRGESGRHQRIIFVILAVLFWILSDLVWGICMGLRMAASV